MSNIFEITYTSANGQTFDLRTFDGLKLETADFHKYGWTRNVTARQFGERLNYFMKKAQTYKCTILFNGSVQSRRLKIDEFHKAIEYDITHKTPGRIKWGLDYINCYITDSDTKPRDDGSAYTENDITIYCANPFWIEEVSTLILPTSQGSRPTDKGYDKDRDVPNSYPYPYSYAYAKNAVFIHVDHFAPSPFKLVVYGPATDVNINISGNIYKVDHQILRNQYMVIDSRNDTPADRKCYLVSESGIITNMFDYRDPAYELFKPVPEGDVVITFDRTHSAELTLYLERSEPRWKD